CSPLSVIFTPSLHDALPILLRSRSELSVAKMLSFLGRDYQYDVTVKFPDGKSLKIDFKVGEKYIEVIDSDADAAKFRQVREQLPDRKSTRLKSSHVKISYAV